MWGRLPKKFVDRIASNLKIYQKIALAQQKADVTEADTVTLVKDIFADVFGYSKYEELTSEHQIRGTYCDLAVKVGGKLRLLVEIKSAGTTLADNHLRQVVDYGAHQGVHWVVLTNAVEWRLVRIYVSHQISHEEICRFDLTEVSPRNEDDLKRMFLLAREGLTTDAMDAFHQRAQILSKFTVAALIRSEPVVAAVQQDLRRLFPDLKVAEAKLLTLIENEVIKREAIDGEKAREAAQRIRKAEAQLEKASKKVRAAEMA